MKKKILMIGNTNGLPGVKIDVSNYRKFFKSQYGGGWVDGEIEIKLNPSAIELSFTISRLKSQDLDYLIIIFSGHGGQERETVLEINANGDIVSESTLKNIATRQLNIYDCCRAYSEPELERRLNENFTKSFSATTSTREKYEKRIMQAIPQQAQLYSCTIGECSYDTPEGGVYSKHLITSASKLTSEYKLVGLAHDEAAIQTERENNEQHPQSNLPKCLSSQQLIISINPSVHRLL